MIVGKVSSDSVQRFSSDRTDHMNLPPAVSILSDWGAEEEM